MRAARERDRERVSRLCAGADGGDVPAGCVWWLRDPGHEPADGCGDANFPASSERSAIGIDKRPESSAKKKIRFRVVREKEGSCTCQASDGAGGAAGGAAVPSAISGGAISTAARHGHAGAAVPATAVRARLPGRAAGGAGELAQVQRLRRTLRPRSGRQPFYIASIPMRAPAFGPNVRVNWQGVLVWKFERVGVRLGGSFLNTLRRGQIWNLETRATRVSITTRANRRSPSDVDPAHLSSR